VWRITKALFRHRKEIYADAKKEIKRIPAVIKSLAPEMVKGIFLAIKERVSLKR
jgi:hypothetical protein